MSHGVEVTDRSGEKAWLPFALIIFATALAHLWCLGSQFYLDDINQIRDNPEIVAGRFLDQGKNTWTVFCYIIQHRLFGMSAVGFHAVNWLLHTSVACVLYGLARDLMMDRTQRGVALFAALLFAVHPLASEIPNYARTQDLAWVTLFSLLASWRMMKFLSGGSWINLCWTGIAVVGATFSKGPGLFHALMMVGAVSIAFARPEHWSFVRKRRWWGVVIAVIGLALVWQIGNVVNRIPALTDWNNPRFISHGLTLCRVFWEFAWRAVIPVSLSADHHIAETLVPPGTTWWSVPDHGAHLAAVSLIGLVGFSMFLGWRKSTRLLGVCLFIFTGTILFRIAYVVPEFMPEYRIYPALPWFCIGAAILCVAAWKWMFTTVSPRIPATILLTVFIVLSAKRSFLWHDLDRLMADVLKQYPAQARAIWELNDRDVATKNWQAIIDRQSRLWPEVERQFITRNTKLAPRRELPSGHFVWAMVAIRGRFARAIAHTQSPAAGLRVMAQLEAHMRQMKMTPAGKPLEWGYFYHDKALIFELAGNLEAAAELLRREEVPQYWPQDRERVERKLKPSS